MNILNLLDSILVDWAKPRTRRAIHNLLLIAAIVVTTWLTAEGDWEKAVGSIALAFYAASNRSNTLPNVYPAGFDDPTPDEARLNPTCCKYEGQDTLPVSGN